MHIDHDHILGDEHSHEHTHEHTHDGVTNTHGDMAEMPALVKLVGHNAAHV